MTREEKQINTWLNDSLQSIHAGSDLFGKVQKRLETSKKPSFHWYGFLKKAIPVSLAIMLLVSFVFPVFGSDGNLMDIYYNYRFQKNMTSLRNTTNDEMKNLDKNINISRLLMNTILEEQYQLNPSIVQYMRSHNMDAVEMVMTLYVSRQANLEPTEIVNLRNQNISWGRIIRKFRIKPRLAFQQMSMMRDHIHDKMVMPVEKKLLIRGRVEAYISEKQILVLENAPFVVHLNSDTTSTVSLVQGANIQIEAFYTLDTQIVTAYEIASYDPQKVGIITLTGEILERYGNQITLRLRDQSSLHIKLSPKIMNSPLSPLIRSSLFVRVEVIRGLNNDLIAINLKRLVPPVGVFKDSLP